jgi:hypothetical protein
MSRVTAKIKAQAIERLRAEIAGKDEYDTAAMIHRIARDLVGFGGNGLPYERLCNYLEEQYDGVQS